MKKLFNNLPFRLLLGVVAGILIGQIANEGFMNIVVTVKYILGQLITFCVPLIIIGFIAPSITKLGNNASIINTAYQNYFPLAVSGEMTAAEFLAAAEQQANQEIANAG